MRRQALAAALLVFLAVLPLAAGPGRSKALFTCGTDPEHARRIEGRFETWNLSVFGFTPDSSGEKPLRIRYRSITRLEFGPRPAERTDLPVTPPCPSRGPDRYLTIFYKNELPPDEQKANARERREKARQDLEERKNRKYQMTKQEKQAQKDRDEAEERDEARRKEQIAVFELGDGVLRPTLRLLEARSGKRITYQDAAAREAAR